MVRAQPARLRSVVRIHPTGKFTLASIKVNGQGNSRWSWVELDATDWFSPDDKLISFDVSNGRRVIRFLRTVKLEGETKTFLLTLG